MRTALACLESIGRELPSGRDSSEILVVTFGKAFGLAGAAVLCDAHVGNYLTQFARHHVYSTAMPPGQAHALTHAARMIKSQSWRRENWLSCWRVLMSSAAIYRNLCNTNAHQTLFVGQL